MLEVLFFLLEKRMQLVCTTFSTESWRPEAGGSEKNYGRRFEAAAAVAGAAVDVLPTAIQPTITPSVEWSSCAFQGKFFAEPSETSEAPFWRLLPLHSVAVGFLISLRTAIFLFNSKITFVVQVQSRDFRENSWNTSFWNLILQQTELTTELFVLKVLFS